jgi:hypothetical protein
VKVIGGNRLGHGAPPDLYRNSCLLRPSQDLRSQFVEVFEIGPHGFQERLNALGGHAGVQEITLDPESFERLGIVPTSAVWRPGRLRVWRAGTKRARQARTQSFSQAKRQIASRPNRVCLSKA